MDKIQISKEVLNEGIIEASELRLLPGVWPQHIYCEGGFLVFTGFDAYGSGIYTSLFGSLVVINS